MVKPGANTDLLEILNRRATKLRSDKNELLVKIDELENKEINVKQVANLSAKWKNASFEEKRSVAAVLINRIVIDESGDEESVWNI